MKFSQLICGDESRLEPKLYKICKTDFKLFLIPHSLSLQKICLIDFILLCMNVKSDPISYSWNFEVRSYRLILRKTWLNLLVPSGYSFVHFGQLLTFNCSNFTLNGKRLNQTVNSEGKSSLEPFSKELKVVPLYSIKTVVSHNFDYQNVNSLCSCHHYNNSARYFCVSNELYKHAF